MAEKSSRKPTKVDVAIGQRVRKRRCEIDMSQETLAARIGVTFQQVQKIETGRNRVACSRMVDIATALEQPVAQFFAGYGPK